MKREDNAKKQLYFHAELIPQVAERGFARPKKAARRRLSWAEWAREPQLGLSAT